MMLHAQLTCSPPANRGELEHDNCSTAARRPAAVLVCVLVVLLIVGLLSTQTIQTLLIVRRSDMQRKRLRQARELVELGQSVSRQHADNRSAGREFSVVVDRTLGLSGTVLIEPQPQDGSHLIRIVAKYPAGSDSEVVASGSIESAMVPTDEDKQ